MSYMRDDYTYYMLWLASLTRGSEFHLYYDI